MEDDLGNKVDIKKVLAFEAPAYEVEFSAKDAMLYALGIGFQQDPLNKEHYKFTYENEEGFTTFPTCPVVICHRRPLDDNVDGIAPINPSGVVHGEESLEVLKPIIVGKKYSITEKCLEYADKKSGALMVWGTEVKDAATGEVYAKLKTSLFLLGRGGFGYKGTMPKTNFPK